MGALATRTAIRHPFPVARRRLREHEYRCPHCGEIVDTWPDEGAGEAQIYVEDCPVCCRPNQIHARLDPEGALRLEVTAE
jgi:hypothetical protein